MGIVTLGCDGGAGSAELRPEGPPDVLAILAEPHPAPEIPTMVPLHCRYVSGILDYLAPREVDGVQVCPPTEAELSPDLGAEPLGFAIRIVFDELLAGDAVETLDCDLDDDGVDDEPLVCTGALDTALSITCVGERGGVVDLAYSGYYVPNGNRVTFPVGPSIYALPESPSTLPTGSECTLQLNDVIVDESGEPIPGDQTNYTFKIAELAIVETVPSDGARLEATDAAAFVFNANLDPAEVDITDVEVLDADGQAIFDYDMEIVGRDSTADAIQIHSILPDGFAPGQYTARVKAGVTLGEVNGGTTVLDTPFELRFTVD